jgi:hypothetical protein
MHQGIIRPRVGRVLSLYRCISCNHRLRVYNLRDTSYEMGIGRFVEVCFRCVHCTHKGIIPLNCLSIRLGRLWRFRL